METELMKEMILNYLFDASDTQIFAFQCGYLSGALIALIFVLLLGLLFLVLRYPRKASGVTLFTSHGCLVISAAAITDLVRSLESEFNDIEISKVYLYHEKKKNLRLFISVIYASDGDSMQAIAESFQNRILEALKHSFGIENIRNIELHVRRSKSRMSF